MAPFLEGILRVIEYTLCNTPVMASVLDMFVALKRVAHGV